MKDPVKAKLKQWAKKWLRTVISALAAAVLAVIFYLAGVLGQPEAKVQSRQAEQPLLAASPALQMTEASQLQQLLDGFPVPALTFLAGAGPELNAGMSYDVAFEDGFARVLELRYNLSSGGTVKVVTIYPARALSLVTREGYTLRTAASQSLAGLSAVRMDGAEDVRFHAQSADALYVVTLPRMDAETLSATLRTLQITAK